MQLFGNGFAQGDQVALMQQGGTSLTATNVNFVSANLLTATFDLTQATAGTYDVVVTPPTGSPITLAGGFTVQEGGAPNVYVDIIGRNEVRFGQPTTFYLVVGNNGNVDSKPGLVSLSIPPTLQSIQTSGAGLYVAGSTSNLTLGVSATQAATDLAQDPPSGSATSSGSSTQNLAFATAGVPSGQTQTASIVLTDLPTDPVSQFTLTAMWMLQESYPATFDDYLAENGVVSPLFLYCDSSLCSSCDLTAVYNAYNAANSAYMTFETDFDQEVADGVKIPVEIGLTLMGDGAIERLEKYGLTTIENVGLSALASEAKACVENFLFDPNSQSCLAPLGEQYQMAKEAAANYLSQNPNLEAAVQAALGDAMQGFGNAISVISGIGQVNADAAASHVALGQFQNLYPQYLQAVTNFYALNCSSISPPPPPPPAPSPGTTSQTVQGVTSLDPNDKVGTKGAGASQFISGITPLRYTIDFGNEDTATAPAQQVVITDQLDTTNDNTGTLNLGPISFGSQSIVPPPFQTSFSTTVDLRPAMDLLVVVSAALNPASGILTWNFQSLDPSTGQPPTDPTVGFLPPGGNGSAFFTVMPKTGLDTGTQINNQATVVFDQNSPIATPTWLNTLDNTPPSSSVRPLPPTESCSNFEVSWSGTDAGSGVKDFTIFVSDNGGAFAPWLTNTTAASATYPGQPGHSYSFYSIAEDQVGNVEAAKTSAEATTETDATSACGRPSLAGRILSSSLSGTTLTVNLQLTDTGAGDARNIQIGDFRLRVLTGTGTVTYLGPLPLSVGDVTIGGTTTLNLTFTVPSSTITKFVLTEDGSLQDVPGNTYSYSIGQVVFP